MRPGRMFFTFLLLLVPLALSKVDESKIPRLLRELHEYTAPAGCPRERFQDAHINSDGDWEVACLNCCGKLNENLAIHLDYDGAGDCCVLVVGKAYIMANYEGHMPE